MEHSSTLDIVPEPVCLNGSGFLESECVEEDIALQDGGIGSSFQRSSTSTGIRRKTYTAERVIGNGSFGIVYQAVAMDTGNVFAIKKVYQDRRYKNRELQIMKDLGVHPNIVRLEHSFYTSSVGSSAGSAGFNPSPNPSSSGNELFLNVVMEYVPETIYKTLKQYSKQKMHMPLLHAQCYTFQIFKGLAYMHAHGICHRDIKPQNLLINPETHALKLCDFGSAKKLRAGEPNVSYICSRYYRAPELIFGATEYTQAVDLWSAGCVLAELLIGSPVFPGENGVDQLVQIIKVLGTPSECDLFAMNPNYTEFRFPYIKPNTWEKVVTGTSVFSRSKNDSGDAKNICLNACQLLKSVLQYDPKSRQNCLDVLSSEFFTSLRHAEGTPKDLFDFSDFEKNYLYSVAANPSTADLFSCTLSKEYSMSSTVSTQDGGQ